MIKRLLLRLPIADWRLPIRFKPVLKIGNWQLAIGNRGLSLACIISLFLLMGCNARLPGKPTEADRWRAPADVSDFTELYTQNWHEHARVFSAGWRRTHRSSDRAAHFWNASFVVQAGSVQRSRDSCVQR